MLTTIMLPWLVGMLIAPVITALKGQAELNLHKDDNLIVRHEYKSYAPLWSRIELTPACLELSDSLTGEMLIVHIPDSIQDSLHYGSFITKREMHEIKVVAIFMVISYFVSESIVLLAFFLICALKFLSGRLASKKRGLIIFNANGYEDNRLIESFYDLNKINTTMHNISFYLNPGSVDLTYVAEQLPFLPEYFHDDTISDFGDDGLVYVIELRKGVMCILRKAFDGYAWSISFYHVAINK